MPSDDSGGRKLDQGSDGVELGSTGLQANVIMIGSFTQPLACQAAQRARQAGMRRRHAVSVGARNHVRCVRIHRHVVTIWDASFCCSGTSSGIAG
jgi:hypothetical protein